MSTGGLFPSRLSNDGVDRLNHKWMLLLMLVLALISFIVPLHPIYHDNNYDDDRLPAPTPSSPSFQSPPRSKPPVQQPDPEYLAVCWTPVEFPSSYVNYANIYCTQQLNKALRGSNDTHVYRVEKYETIPTSQADRRWFDPFTRKRVEERNFQRKERQRLHDVEEELRPKVTKLMTFQVPVTLFLMAVGLGLAQAVWGVMADWLGSFNLNQTLAAASCPGILTNLSNRTQAYEDIAESVTATTTTCGRSPRVLSVLYLVKKILAVLVVLVFVLVLLLHSLPEVDKLQNKLDKSYYSPSDSTGTSADVKIAMGDSMSKMYKKDNNNNNNSNNNNNNNNYNNNNNNDNVSDVGTEPSTAPFLCDFSIRSLQTIQRYTVQCIPVKQTRNNRTPDFTSASSSFSSSSSSPSSSSSSSFDLSQENMKNLLEFESLVIQMASTLMVVLLVANLLSLFTWGCKLFSSSSRSALGLRSTIPTDVVLLIQMAHINTSAHVAVKLARGFDGAKV